MGRILVRLGFVTEATIRDMLSETGDAKVVDLRNISVDPDVLARVPIDVAKQYNIFPINYDEVKKMISIGGVRIQLIYCWPIRSGFLGRRL